MNNYSLFKIFPNYFYLIGIILFIISIIIGCIQKYSALLIYQNFSLKHTQLILMTALVLLIFSNKKTDDERQQQIRLQVSFFGYYGILLFIMVLGVTGILTNHPFSIYDVMNGILVYLLYNVSFIELANRTNIIDKIHSYKPITGIISIFIFFLLLYTNSRFWGWGYFDGV